jgi:cobalt-zinc-cadmium efflux system protein
MSRVERLWVVLGLNVVLVAGLVVVGVRSHSLAVFAEGGDYVADGLAIVLTLVAIWLDRRRSASGRMSRFPKATSVAALVNAGWLLLLSGLVAGAAVYRLASGATEVHGVPVLIASGIAAVVMFIGALILGGDDHEINNAEIDNGEIDNDDLHMRAVLLDTAADAAAAAGVAVTGAVIAVRGGWYWLDPVVAIVIAGVIAFHTIKLLGKVQRSMRVGAVANS